MAARELSLAAAATPGIHAAVVGELLAHTISIDTILTSPHYELAFFITVPP
jgi:hypothetical protein